MTVEKQFFPFATARPCPGQGSSHERSQATCTTAAPATPRCGSYEGSSRPANHCNIKANVILRPFDPQRGLPRSYRTSRSIAGSSLSHFNVDVQNFRRLGCSVPAALSLCAEHILRLPLSDRFWQRQSRAQPQVLVSVYHRLSAILSVYKQSLIRLLLSPMGVPR